MTDTEIYATLSSLSKDRSNWNSQLPCVAMLLGHPSAKIQSKALWLLGEMGLLFPQEIQPFVKRIADMLFDADAKIRERAVGALGRIGRSRYGSIEPYMGSLLKKAMDDAPLVRMNFIWAAENITSNFPEAFSSKMDLFIALLEDQAERVRIEAPEIFRVMGKHLPEMVLPYIEKLRYMAEHDENEVVRIHAAGAVKATLSTLADPKPLSFPQ